MESGEAEQIDADHTPVYTPSPASDDESGVDLSFVAHGAPVQATEEMARGLAGTLSANEASPSSNISGLTFLSFDRSQAQRVD